MLLSDAVVNCNETWDNKDPKGVNGGGQSVSIM